jgi:hypothetical protein
MEQPYPFVVGRSQEAVVSTTRTSMSSLVPYDMPITGYKTENINTLRLWKAEPAQEFDFQLCSISQRFDDAVIQRNRVNDICRVLYPNDSSYDGKVLRVRQQYSLSQRHAPDHRGRLHPRSTVLIFQSSLRIMRSSSTTPIPSSPSRADAHPCRISKDGLDGGVAGHAGRLLLHQSQRLCPKRLKKGIPAYSSSCSRRLLQIIERIDGQFPPGGAPLPERGPGQHAQPAGRRQDPDGMAGGVRRHAVNGVAAMHHRHFEKGY